MSLHSKPTYPSEQVSEILYGETFTIYERGNGWSWGQANSDGYVGYIIGGMLDAFDGPTTANARVTALMAPVFSAPNIKASTFDLLPLNAVVRDETQGSDFVEIRPSSFVHRRHLGPIAPSEADFASVAERFLGVPYVWGGKTFAGLDCSGLIQTALQATGKAAPRDTDMMEKALGDIVPLSEVRRGDLVFWKGHMGVMLDEDWLLHANAFHMAVAIEPLAEAMARIEKIAGPVTAVKRL
jgi:cell wall-associated NlpC family hydrolase